MYKFPVRIPIGWKLAISQPFKSTELAAWYTSHGITMPTHDGVDIICGTREQTWGSPVVWPFPWPGKVWDAWVDSPMGATQHAHCQIDTTNPATGEQYSVIYLHLSAVTKTRKTQQDPPITYQEGDVIGYIGNNGSVSPPPTGSEPFNGSHLHLGLGVKNPGELNYSMIDPLIVFDINDPYRGEDQPNRDTAVYEWAKANGATGFKFSKDLYYGLTDQDVLQLQKYLNARGFIIAGAGKAGSTGFETDYFGDATKKAVIAYQKANGIQPAVGYFGSITRASVNK